MAAASRSSPVLASKRLKLRSLRDEDAEAWYEQISHPDVARFYGNGDGIERKSLGSVRAFIGFCEGHFRRRTAVYWAITLAERDSVIGFIKLFDIQNSKAELGYWLGRQYWGKGLMSEAVAQVTAFGFDSRGLHRIWAGTDPRNLASCRLLERNGFVREGVLRKTTMREDQWCDSAIYGLLREECQTQWPIPT